MVRLFQGCVRSRRVLLRACQSRRPLSWSCSRAIAPEGSGVSALLLRPYRRFSARPQSWACFPHLLHQIGAERLLVHRNISLLISFLRAAKVVVGWGLCI